MCLKTESVNRSEDSPHKVSEEMPGRIDFLHLSETLLWLDGDDINNTRGILLG
jgi:hypothetical protein